eukprot:2374138-Heterocapsa_arctica.AAC.1
MFKQQVGRESQFPRKKRMECTRQSNSQMIAESTTDVTNEMDTTRSSTNMLEQLYRITEMSAVDGA